MDYILRTPFADVYPPTHLSLTDFVMRDVDQYGDDVCMIDPVKTRQFTFREVKQYVQNAAGALHSRGIRKGDVVCICLPNVIEYIVVFHAVVKLGAIITTIDPVKTRQFTFREVKQYIQNAAGALHSRGIRKGDVVCVCLPNVIEYIVVFHAVVKLGAIITTVNPLYTADELATQLEDCHAVAIVTNAAHVEKVNEACAKYGRIKKMYLIGDAGGFAGYESFTDLMRLESPPPPPVTINPKEDLCCLPYSSGTTGRPKGVMLTHYNVIAGMCQMFHPYWKLIERGDTLIGVMPFFHIYGIIVGLIAPLYQRIKMVVLEKFELQLYLEAIQKYEVSSLFIVPPLAVLLAKHPLVSNYDVSAVKRIFCGAAPLSRELAIELKGGLPGKPDIVQGCGMTETSGALVLCPPSIQSGSVGQVLGNTELKVIDLDTGEALPSYRDGEICMKGPQVMKGYLGNDEATKATIEPDGWLHTGDIGYYDKDGCMFIIDRLKELIKYKGFQVAPAELEGLLLKHPSVADAAVIGKPDYVAGELPRAYVVLRVNCMATAEEIIKYVDSQVSPHKKLRGGAEFCKEIPKSPSGKILRRLLKQELQNKSKL